MRLYSIEDHFDADDDEMKYNTTDGILVPKSKWQRWVQTCQTSMLVRIVQPNKSQICCVSGYHSDDINSVYLPSWMFYQVSKDEDATLEPLWDEDEETEPLPLATKITLRPLDNVIYHADIVEELSTFLQNFQTLQKGSTLVVPVQKLGNYLVDVFVEDIQPSNEVLLRGDVPLELEEPLEAIHEWNGSDSSDSVPKLQNQHNQKNNDEPFEDEFPLLPMAQQTQQTQSFIPYSGTGNRLGS